MNEFQRKMKERADKFNQSASVTASQPQPTHPEVNPKQTIPYIPYKPLIKPDNIPEIKAHTQHTDTKTNIDHSQLPMPSEGGASAIDKYKQMILNKEEHTKPISTDIHPIEIHKPEIQTPATKSIEEPHINKASQFKEIYKNMPLPGSTAPHREQNQSNNQKSNEEVK